MSDITKEEFAEWKSHPVTIEIYKELKEIKKSLEESLGKGDTICYTAEETHGTTNRVVGQITGLNQLLELTYEDVE